MPQFVPISITKTFQLSRWALLGLALLAHPASAQTQCQQLVWSDEFTTTGDLSKWRVYEGDGCEMNLCNFGNNELQVYRAANATVTGGYLNITARAQNSTQGGRSYNYTSAKLLSKTATNALQTFRYGRMEASIKLPSAQGVWPAFWMLADPNNWPNTGEIDIMEAKHRNPTSVAGTVHYNAGGARYTSREYNGNVNLSVGFHTYAVEWGPNVVRWYIDNTLYHTATPQTTQGGSWPFNTGNFYLMLNAAVGGPNTPFTGNQPATASDYPTTMQVDYVRVYSQPASVSVQGSNAVNANDQGIAYQVAAVTGATYAWTVPNGATIASGQGTNAVQVNWGTTSGLVSVVVTAPNCPPITYTLDVTVGPPLPIGPNLALRKPVVASSIEDPSLPAALAVDGSSTTRWASAFTDNEWLYVDLQNTYDLTNVVLRWEAAHASSYAVQTSPDASIWTTRYNTSTGDGGTDILPLTGRARYVRVLGQRRATAYGYSLFELEVYGTAVLSNARAAEALVQVHPNPVTDVLTVENAGAAASLTLTDVQGRVLRQQPVKPSAATLDLHDLPAGLYLLTVRSEMGTVVRKVLKN
ncbi:family 16 glycosylhydrolase [Hymenobacter sp. ASUV-10]|uniref:Family 16 glycosylhydrolase n=1 Tax=Hymenobacter aranciens TaxID=3063996 RepID=A0ABT9BB13_9BACT|nr:family 16 glycosylhydrolase [Hymenobacter sp. ASUV-10]MDO7874212.1 family 16 glycosylhydrolase [Hymenobacter sp. ASUV-10]